MAIKTYKRGSNAKLSANFKVSEFLCHGAGCCTEGKIDEALVAILQKIRDHFGKPVHISSAYRCAKWNKQVGGVSRSYHCSGQAADIKVEGIAPAEVAKYAERIGVLGIGLYDSDADGHFVHVDTRTTKSYWYGRKQEKRTTFGGSTYTLKFSVLKKGDKGENVKALQILLKGRGYNVGTTGNFGNGTESVVKKFQKANGIAPDGVVDENVMATLLGMI